MAEDGQTGGDGGGFALAGGQPWEEWGIPERTYFRWKGKGAPFTTPAEMLEWGKAAGIQRRFLVRFEEMATDPAPEVAVAAWTYDVAGGEGSGIAESLDFARRQVRFFRDKFEEAAARGDQKGVDSWGSKVAGALTTLRQLEKEAPKILIDSGHAWPAREVEVVLREVFGVISKGFRLMIHRVDAKLRAEADLKERERIWKREVDALFGVLRVSGFTEGLANDHS